MMARVRMARIVSENVVVVVIDCCDHHQCKMRKKTEFAVVALL